MLYRNDGDRLARAVADRRNGRDPLFPLLALLAPLPIDRRGAREPIGERPVEYLCQLGTYGKASPRLEDSSASLTTTTRARCVAGS